LTNTSWRFYVDSMTKKAKSSGNKQSAAAKKRAEQRAVTVAGIG